jgi:hypothetical protein
MAEMINSDSKNTFDIAFENLNQVKEQYQSQIAQLQTIKNQVDEGNGKVSAAKLAKSLASEIYSNKSQLLIEAENHLANANNDVSSLINFAQKALNDVGEAKYKLTLALNKLFVAQAAKEQADKAINILYTQNSISDQPFAGCNQGSFPGMFGTGRVKIVNQNGFTLESGQILLSGPCTASALACSVGDMLYFEGYLRSGCIHLLRFSKS